MAGQQHIGRYKVLSELGSGGMGVVYLAEDTNLQRTVAIKILPINKKEGRAQLRERFLREARVSARLDHPYVIHLHDVGQDEDIDFIVMEYVRGGTLRDSIEANGDEAMDIDEAGRLFWEICQGVDYAHRMGIVHRDLKPENIMVTDEHHIKIMDFGLAWQDEQARLTRDGAIMGTVAYFSPEQARGERADERSDIYSLGAILYEMLTNHMLFEASSPGEMIAHHLSTPPPSPRKTNPAVPVGLEKIVLRCLEKTREARYQHVSEVLIDLEKFLTTRNISFSQLRYGSPTGVERRSEPRPAASMVTQPAATQPPPDEPAPEAPRPNAPGPYWNPPPVLRFDQQPWMEILKQLPNRKDSEDSEPDIEPSPPPPKPAPRMPPPLVNPWEIKAPVPGPGDEESSPRGFGPLGPPNIGTPEQIVSADWLKEAQDNAGWGQYENLVARIKRDDALRSVVRADEANLIPDNIECKRCHTANPGDRKYCQECAGLLTPSRYRMQQEARELTELGIMYYKQGLLGDARRELVTALERTPELFDANFYMGRLELDEHDLDEAKRRFNLALTLNPKDSRPYAYLADIYREQGQIQDAIHSYQQAVNLDPNDADLRCRLAFMLANIGRVADAIAEYQAVVEAVPEHIEAFSQLGIIYGGQDMVDESIAAFEAVIGLDPQNRAAYRWLARLYTRRNKLSQAEKAYLTAIQLNPSDAELYAQLGTVYESQRKEDAALKVLRQSINLDAGNLEARTRLASLYLKHNQPRQAILELEQAVAFHPTSSTLHRHLGELYLSESNLDKALFYFERAVSLDPQAAEAHSRLGQLYLKGEYDDNAIAEYQRAITIEPYNPVYREELGMAYFAQKRPDLAIVELRKAAMLDSTNADYQRAMGLICEEEGRLDEAVQALQKALELTPRDPMAHGLLGKVYFRQGLANFAMRELQQAVDLEPGNILLQIYMARAYSQVGQPQQAIKHFRNAIELGGGDKRETKKFMAQSYQDLAKAYIDSGQYRKAAEVLDAALSNMPENPQALYLRGLACMGMGDMRKARELLNKAATMEPQNGAIFFGLGQFHDRVNEPIQALKCYREACRLAPNRASYVEGLANCLASQKLYADAIAAIGVALKMRPSRAAVYYGMMGMWSLDKVDIMAAVEALQKAVEAGSRNVQVYLRLSQTLFGMGRVQDAKVALKAGREYLSEDDRATIDEALKRLRNR